MDDPKMKERVGGLVTLFIPVDNFGRVSITEMDLVLQIVKDTKIQFDGVFTLVEDEGPLVSHLATALGLTSTTYLLSLHFLTFDIANQPL
jgi:hypothetical protein